MKNWNGKKNSKDMFIRFDTIHKHDKDRRTDGHRATA